MADSVEKRVARLREQIRKHDHAYYVLAAPTISDRQYDQLFEDLRELESKHPELVTRDSPTQRVGGAPIEGFKHVRHAQAMLSVDNTYDEAQLREFDRRVAKGLGSREYRYVVDPKVDGVAVALHYKNGLLERAVTRGDGKTGDDITQNVRTIRSVPLRLCASDVPDVLEVRGEIVWPVEAFEEFNRRRVAEKKEPLANPRNGAAGTLKQLDPRNVAGRGLLFVAHGFGEIVPLTARRASDLFEQFRRWGIPTSPFCETADHIDEIIAQLSVWDSRRKELPYETDGLVIKVDALDQREALGATSRYPRWCIAYKFAAEQAESVLKGVDFQVGKLGTITPRAVMDPVQLSGTTVRHASLHNFDQVARLDVRIGDTVIVEKAGEIIPQVVRVVIEKRPKSATPIFPPTKCPVCRADVEKDEGGVYIRCINPSCPAQLKERLIHFAGRNQMDIEGAGQVVIETLVDKELVGDIAGLYGLTLESLEGLRLPDKELGTRAVDTMIDSIKRAGKRDSYVVLSNTKIPGCDEAALRALCHAMGTVQEVANADRNGIRRATGDCGTADAVFAFLNPSSKSDLERILLGLAGKKRLHIVGLGKVRIHSIVESKLVRRVADLFELESHRERLSCMSVPNTLGRKSAESLLAGIKASKSQPLSRLLASLNIRHVGSSMAEVLAEAFGSMDEIAKSDEDALAQVDGVGPELARSIVRFFRSEEGVAILDRLKKAGVNMIQPKRSRLANGPFDGLAIVVTGTLESMSRSEAERLIKTLGGRVAGSVSKKTDLVVFGEGAGSKLGKAKKLGVKVIDESEFLKQTGHLREDQGP